MLFWTISWAPPSNQRVLQAQVLQHAEHHSLHDPQTPQSSIQHPPCFTSASQGWAGRTALELIQDFYLKTTQSILSWSFIIHTADNVVEGFSGGMWIRIYLKRETIKKNMAIDIKKFLKLINKTILCNIHLPMQGTWFDPWSGKIPHILEQLSLCTTTTEPTCCSDWGPGT